jgi:C-terminal processing protease CtpA/Prc
MFRLMTLTAGLLFLTVGAWAKPKPTPKPVEKMMANLLKRCEDGVAVACYDYGKTLRLRKSPADKRRGNLYLRRACTLAYAPACVTHSTVSETKPMKDPKPKVDANGRPCNGVELAKTAKLSGDGRSVAEVSKGSLWEQSGVVAGDEVISVNGQPFTGQEQIADALDKGGAVLNLRRNGRETSVMVNCP